MSIIDRPEPRLSAHAVAQHAAKLSVSPQDHASSIILVLLLSLGTLVVMMFGVWLSSRLRYEVPAMPVVMVDDLGGGGGGKGTAPGIGDQQLEEVSPEEVKDLQEVSVDQSMKMVTDAVAQQSANFEVLQDGL